MEVTLKRRIINELTTTYLPSMFLICISYVSTYFKPFYFEAVIIVNITTMLVMTTIFTAVMDRLPATAYIKMIDIWLIYGQLIPFTEVVLCTIIEYHRDGDEDGTRTINHHGQERVVQVAPSTNDITTTDTDLRY